MREGENTPERERDIDDLIFGDAGSAPSER